jgi:hypothetical protein
LAERQRWRTLRRLFREAAHPIAAASNKSAVKKLADGERSEKRDDNEAQKHPQPGEDETNPEKLSIMTSGFFGNRFFAR